MVEVIQIRFDGQQSVDRIVVVNKWVVDKQVVMDTFGELSLDISLDNFKGDIEEHTIGEGT